MLQNADLIRRYLETVLDTEARVLSLHRDDFLARVTDMIDHAIETSENEWPPCRCLVQVRRIIDLDAHSHLREGALCAAADDRSGRLQGRLRALADSWQRLHPLYLEDPLSKQAFWARRDAFLSAAGDLQAELSRLAINDAVFLASTAEFTLS